jgi:hypothetical protein
MHELVPGPVSAKPVLGKRVLKWEPFAMSYARFALGLLFYLLSPLDSGIWGDGTGPDSFKHFVEYTAEVNSFLTALRSGSVNQDHFDFAMGSDCAIREPRTTLKI